MQASDLPISDFFTVSSLQARRKEGERSAFSNVCLPIAFMNIRRFSLVRKNAEKCRYANDADICIFSSLIFK